MHRLLPILFAAAAAAQEPEPRIEVRGVASISIVIQGPLPLNILTGTNTIPRCNRFPGAPAIVLDGPRPRLAIPAPPPEKPALTPPAAPR